MSKLTLLKKIQFITLLLVNTAGYYAHAQNSYISNSSGLYKLTNSNGQCQTQKIDPFCADSNGRYMSSIGLFHDTLFYMDGNDLYRVVPGIASSCAYVTSIPSANNNFNSLAVDKWGIIYTCNRPYSELFSIDPVTKISRRLGFLPIVPAGDLMFYKDKLLYATDGIYEINLDTPSKSKQYMPTPGYDFFGLLSLPFDCNGNKVYGVTSSYPARLIELDLAKRTIIGEYCGLPFEVSDAASNVDNGNTIGVTIDAIQMKAPCSDTVTGAAVKLNAFTAIEGGIDYWVDGMLSNNTGIFPHLSFGQHFFHLANQRGCVNDTLVTIPTPLTAIQSVQNTPTSSCDQSTGALSITGRGGYPPILYSIDNGAFQTGNTFSQLNAGTHSLSVKDAMGCQRDTTVYIGYVTGPSYISSLQVVAASCIQKGQLSINLKPGTDGSAISTALNNGAVTNSLQYNGLEAGTYQLTVTDASNCRYDTFFVVKQVRDNPPAISITTTHQFCFANNGKTSISIIGAENPYLVNFNKTGFKAQYAFKTLGPGSYPISINNKNGCQWDTVITVKAYPKSPVQYELEKINPDCDITKNGQLKLTVSGAAQPYTILLENRQYANGSWIDKLTEKKYLLQFQNSDGCVVDSTIAELVYNFKPACDTLYIPNAFSPNGDGENDFFKPIFTSFLQDVAFTVFNRYGQKVFESRGKTKGWDGTVAGKAQATGQYIWTIRYKNYQGKLRSMKGICFLMR